MAGRTRGSRQRRWTSRPRTVIVAAFAAALVLSLVVSVAVGLVAAPATAAPADKREPTQTYPGDDQDIPLLMYRFRHTELPDPPEVTYDRTVAGFDFVNNGIKMVAVGPSIPGHDNGTKTALIDIYRQDPTTGDWYLVDLSGKPLAVDGKPVNWKKSSAPTISWDLTKETDQEVVDGLADGFHAEQLVSLFLRIKVHDAHVTTRSGTVEQIPCNGGCRSNLRKKTWFPNLEIENVHYIVNAFGPKTVRNHGQSKYESSSAYKEDIVDDWMAAGIPINHEDLVYAMGYKYRELETPGSPPTTGAVAAALGPESNPGGIDFTTLQLRYLSQAPGGKLQYAFSASSADPSVHNVQQGRVAAVQASDAFFVWLSMPPSSFWVNLNPNEPRRIVDSRLGTTDVGRVLLQADFHMKQITGRLIYPRTKLGRRFWGPYVSHGCIDMREWIVPAPATVYEHGDSLSIIKAPLKVKSESEFLKDQGKKAVCRHSDTRMEKAFRTLVLPKINQAINHAPEFAELRRVYLSRVAAEWYRQQHGQDGTLRSLIDSGDVSTWPAIKAWSPRTVYRQYVHSYRHKEFNVKERGTRGNRPYVRTYTFGGVDFSKVILHRSSSSPINREDPDLAATEQRSLRQKTIDHQGRVWLGAVSQPHVAGASDIGGNSRHQTQTVHLRTTALIIILLCGLITAGLIISLIITLAATGGRRRGLLAGGMIILLAVSIITGATALAHLPSSTTAATRPTPRLPVPSSSDQPSTRLPPAPPTTRTPAAPRHAPTRSHPAPSRSRPVPKHVTPRWTMPKRGHRPAMPMFAATWHTHDRPRRQEVSQLTFAFSTPRSYGCVDSSANHTVFCGRHFGKRDPYVVIVNHTCGCNAKQVIKIVDKDFRSKAAFSRLLPADPYTQVSANGNGKPKYQYWMSRLYATGDRHRPTHHIDVYAQARTRSQDLQVRKIIGDIYDATR